MSLNLNRVIWPQTFFAAAVCFFTVTLGAFSETFSFYCEDVMGTSLELTVEAENFSQASEAESAVLNEIERLSALISTYDPQSEISAWSENAGNKQRLSKDSIDLLALSDEWQRRSGGAYNPTVESLSRLWKEAESNNRLPLAAEIREVLSRAGNQSWSLDLAEQSATRLGDAPFSLNAIAKGFVIDRAAEKAFGSISVKSIILSVGGDILVKGNIVREVEVANPFTAGANIARVHFTDAAIATSGNYERGFDIQGKHFSHIIDPRSGQPVDHIVSATVIAPDAATADVLATICSVLTTDESLNLINTIPGVECLLVKLDGKQSQSAGWSEFKPKLLAAAGTETAADANEVPTEDSSSEAPAFDASYELEVEFKLGVPEAVETPAQQANQGRGNEVDATPPGQRGRFGGFGRGRGRGGRGGYRSPFVAVWVEGEDKVPVRTLALWYSDQRWLRDLRSWNSSDRLRTDRSIDIKRTVTQATRPAGKYKVVWDGKNDIGNLVKAGEYTVFVEAVREHGGYEILSQKIEFSSKPAHEELEGKRELVNVVFDYHKVEKKEE